MKTIKILMIIIAFITLNSMGLNAQCMMNHNHSNSSDSQNHQNHSKNTPTNNKDTYLLKVDGKCGMCKNRIEKAALNVKGVNTAEWNEETHLLTVNLKPEIKVEDVSKAIANVGHDTEKNKADDKVYNALPMCCKYRN